MIKFIHAADIHLDSPLKGLARYEGAPVEAIRGATRRALENLVRLAIDEQVDFVLIAGDLYDGDWKDHNTGLFFVSQLVKLRDANIPAFVIHGNHDAANKMTKSLTLPKNVDGQEVVLAHKKPETRIIESLGVAIHGQSFAKAAVEENAALRYPAAVASCFNIGMLHTSLDMEREDDHARYAPCRLSDLAAKDYQYWALGHIHERSTRIAGTAGAAVVFPGNTQGRHIRETGAKGCMLVQVDDRGKVETEFRALDVFRWQRLEVNSEAAQSGDDVLARFSEVLSRTMLAADGLPLAVRVTISGKCSARVHQQLSSDSDRWTNDMRAIALDVGSGEVWVEKIDLCVSPYRQPANIDGPLGELIALVAELRGSDTKLATLGLELAELDRRLPDELKRGADTVQIEQIAELRGLLNEVEPLLVGRLLASVEEP